MRAANLSLHAFLKMMVLLLRVNRENYNFATVIHHTDFVTLYENV